MLYRVGESSNPVTSVPHAPDFNRWKGRLASVELKAIEGELDNLITAKISSGEDIVTAGWLPGELCPNGSHDWAGTPFESIYDKACRGSWGQTAMCFGLFVWERIMKREEAWHFMRCELDGEPISSMTYFRCTQSH